jgi:hypothetical protein
MLLFNSYRANFRTTQHDPRPNNNSTLYSEFERRGWVFCVRIVCREGPGAGLLSTLSTPQTLRPPTFSPATQRAPRLSHGSYGEKQGHTGQTLRDIRPSQVVTPITLRAMRMKA